MPNGKITDGSSARPDLEPLVAAIKAGDVASLQSVLNSTTNPEKLLATKISQNQPTNHSIGKDATLLQLASYRNWPGENTASVLLKAGAELDIHSACGLGMAEEIESILKNDPEQICALVNTYYPLQYAITGKQVEAIECLMRYDDNPNRDLKKMAYFGWEDEVVDTKYTPWKPIHMASLWGFDASRIPVAECLAKHGADLHAVSPLDGFRPIHLVAMPNRVDMIRFFVANGVDVDSRTQKRDAIELSAENDGPVRGTECTALMVACGEGFVEATQCLIELGADINARNSEGKSPLDFAQARYWPGQPYDEVLQLLRNNGAK